MNAELAEHISLLAAPIYAALLSYAKVQQLESDLWRRDARSAALRQAHALWLEALEHEP